MIKQYLLTLALPLIVGSATPFLYNWLKKSVSWIDNLQGQTHVVIIGALSVLLPLIGKIIPNFPTDIHGIDATTISQLLTLLLTQVIHAKIIAPDSGK